MLRFFFSTRSVALDALQQITQRPESTSFLESLHFVWVSSLASHDSGLHPDSSKPVTEIPILLPGLCLREHEWLSAGQRKETRGIHWGFLGKAVPLMKLAPPWAWWRLHVVPDLQQPPWHLRRSCLTAKVPWCPEDATQRWEEAMILTTTLT